MQATPLVVKNHVFLGQAEENRDDRSMGSHVCRRRDETRRRDQVRGTVALTRKSRSTKAVPLPVAGKIVDVDTGGNLVVFDPKTGAGNRFREKNRHLSHGQPVVCRWQALHLLFERRLARFTVHRSRPERLLDRQRLTGGETNASPIVSHGRIYLQQADVLWCIGNKDQKPEADPRPAPPSETPTDTDPIPAWSRSFPVNRCCDPESSDVPRAALQRARPVSARRPTERGQV